MPEWQGSNDQQGGDRQQLDHAHLDPGIIRADIDTWRPPRRPWLVKDRILRRSVGFTVSPPGTGKTALQMAYAISLATGQPILGREVLQPVKVWFYSNEEDKDELYRRLIACCWLNNIKPSSLIGKLRISSGYGSKSLVVLRKFEHITVKSPETDELIDQMIKAEIGALFVDPFGSTHTANENANGEIEEVMSQWRRVSKEADAAIDIAAHCPKQGSDSEAHAGRLDAIRGASSAIGAARLSYTLAGMNEESAKLFGIDADSRQYLIREDRAKGNYTPKADQARWFEMVPICLDNDPDQPDWVAAIRPMNGLQTTASGNGDSKNAENLNKIRFALRQVKIRFGEKARLTDKLPEILSLTNLGESTVRRLIPLAIPHENQAAEVAKADFYFSTEPPTKKGGKPIYFLHSNLTDGGR